MKSNASYHESKRGCILGLYPSQKILKHYHHKKNPLIYFKKNPIFKEFILALFHSW